MWKGSSRHAQKRPVEWAFHSPHMLLDERAIKFSLMLSVTSASTTTSGSNVWPPATQSANLFSGAYALEKPAELPAHFVSKPTPSDSDSEHEFDPLGLSFPNFSGA